VSRRWEQASRSASEQRWNREALPRAILLTDEQVQRIAGGAKTPPVRVTVNRHTFSGRIGRMGGESLLGFNRTVREGAGVETGQELELEIVLDSAPRDVEMPAELTAALAADAPAHEAFDGLSHTHRKEFARWVGDAKRSETRERRASETIRMLHEGRTR
jgi:hypothetical protein